MKLFDYKLILLIALTFVIYFMYRELQNLNQRIEKVEKNVEEIPKKQIPYQHEPKFINFEQPKNNMVDYIEEEPIINNNIDNNIIDTNIIDNNIIDNVNLNKVLPNHSCTISTEEEDSEELLQMNEDNKMEAEDAVEIYSNDNIESISSQKTSEIDEDAIIIKEPILIGQHVIDRVINDIYQDDNSLTSSISIEEIIMNNESSELINDDDILDFPINNIESLKTEPSKTEPSKTEPHKTEPPKTEPSKTEPLKTEPPKTEQHISDDNEEPIIEIKVDDLVKEKKLNELKEMANQLNIELRHNGRAKTKKQLAEEICNLQNNQ